MWNAIPKLFFWIKDALLASYFTPKYPVFFTHNLLFKNLHAPYCMSQKKQALTNGVPSYKFCFEEGCYNQIIEMSQVLATTCQKT